MPPTHVASRGVLGKVNEMGIAILPTTRCGKWALGLFGTSILLFCAATAWPGPRSGDLPNIVTTPVFASLIYLGFASCILAALAGLWAINKHKERALLVYISIPLGVFYLVGLLVMLVAFLVYR